MRSLFLISLALLLFHVNAQPLNGEFSIGTGGDYITITEAILDLNSNGVGSGGVTFLINEGESFTEQTPEITASGTSDNAIYFRNAGTPGINNPVISIENYGIEDAGIIINGGDYISFDGLDIFCTATGEDGIEYGYYLYNDANYNEIKNCRINLNINNEYPTWGILLAGIANYNKFYNNTISDCHTAYKLTGLQGYAFGNEIGIIDGGDSHIYHISGAGISLMNMDETKVFNILVEDIFTESTAVAGIGVGNGGPYYIYDNEVRNVTSTSYYGGPVGIALNASEVYCFNNKVHNIFAEGDGAGAYGISAFGADIHIYNNFIYDIKAPNSEEINTVNGIHVYDADEIKIHFNTVYLDYEANVSGNESAAFFMSNLPELVELKNNIFVNRVNTNCCAVVFRKEGANLSNIAESSDNNCLYVSNPDFNHLIYFDGTNEIQTLAGYQALMTPREQNAVSENPPFINDIPPYNLHIDPGSATQLDNGGSFIVNIAYDIDYELRSDPPDIGADEFTVLFQFENFTENDPLKIFQNKRQILIKLDKKQFEGKLQIIDMNGHILASKETTTTESPILRCSLISSGIYLIIATEKNGMQWSKKLFLQ